MGEPLETDQMHTASVAMHEMFVMGNGLSRPDQTRGVKGHCG